MNYCLESIKTLRTEIYPLFEAAWNEVDQCAEHMPLDPDWERTEMLEDMGMWRTYTLRTDEKELVGFICVLVQPLLHSKNHFHAFTDVAYVKPEHRGQFKKLLAIAEDDLKEEGVTWFSFVLKSWDKRGAFLEDMGYVLHENNYQKKVN